MRFAKTPLLLILTLITLLSACAHQTPAPGHPGDSEIRKQLLGQYSQWKGVPHKLGGQSKHGIDCSGFTQLTYKQLFGIRLPRTVAQQRKAARRIKKSQLKAGDLVFFDHRVPNHVGIALGDGRFLHVSSQKGVSIAPLNSGYWAKYVQSGGRVFP